MSLSRPVVEALSASAKPLPASVVFWLGVAVGVLAAIPLALGVVVLAVWE